MRNIIKSIKFWMSILIISFIISFGFYLHKNYISNHPIISYRISNPEGIQGVFKIKIERGRTKFVEFPDSKDIYNKKICKSAIFNFRTELPFNASINERDSNKGTTFGIWVSGRKYKEIFLSIDSINSPNWFDGNTIVCCITGSNEKGCFEKTFRH